MPDWTDAIRRRLDAARVPIARQDEIVDELSQHLQDRYDELVAGGAPDRAARTATLAELDDPALLASMAGVDRVPSDAAPLGGPAARPFADVWQDVRYGLRIAVKERVSAPVIVLT